MHWTTARTNGPIRIARSASGVGRGAQDGRDHAEVGEGIERGSAVGEGEDPMAAPDEQPLDERPDSRLILDDGDQGRSDGERRIPAGDPPDRSVPRLRRAERA
jgi:hypothetical protein